MFRARAGEGGAVGRASQHPRGEKHCRGTGSHYAHLGAAALGPQEEPKGRTPELCKEVVSTYIENCQLFVYVGAYRRTYRIASCLCRWEPPRPHLATLITPPPPAALNLLLRSDSHRPEVIFNDPGKSEIAIFKGTNQNARYILDSDIGKT